MPQLVASYLFSWIVATFVEVGTAIAVVEIVTALAVNFLIGALSNALSGSKRNPGGPLPQDITVRSSVAPRTIVYGQVRTSGVIMFEGLSGDRGQYLWIVVALAGHQVEAITDVWLDQDQIPNSSINATTGAVTSNKYAGKVSIWRFLGTDAQNASSDMITDFPGTWDSAHKGRGVAYIVLRLEQDTTLFPGGGPSGYFAMVKGKRVYDPRLDSTNGGSGSHRLTDATTWAYSANPALCAADFLTSGSVTFDVATPNRVLGMGQDTARVNWSYVASAANICDQTVSVPSPQSTQKRYVIAGVFSCGDTNADSMKKLLATMIGQWAYSGGKFRLYAGAYDTPTLSFNDTDLIGDGYEILAPGRDTLYNAVSPVYIDPSRNFQQVNSRMNTNSTYEAADGEQIVNPIDLTAVDDEYRSQRIGAVHEEQSRNLVTIKLYTGLNGFKITIWETFMLSLIDAGWTNKVFRCMNWELNTDQPGAVITAREESSAAYSDPTVLSYLSPSGASSAGGGSDLPMIPEDLTCVPVNDAIIFSWTQSQYFPPGATYRLYRSSSSSGFASATKWWEGSSPHYTVSVTDASNPTLYYWVTAAYKGGETSPTPDASAGLAAKALSVTSGFRAVANPGGISRLGSAASQTSPFLSISVSNGVSPFTYAWTRTSGDSSTTISSSSAASVTFTRSAMAIGGIYISVWQCVVTDSTSPTPQTYTISVTVRFERDPNTGYN